MAERWLPVVGFPEYEVSDCGRVRRVRVLNYAPARNGYVYVRLHACDGRRSFRSVHSLVLEAFEGVCSGKEANHKNGIKTDNRVENLEWVTRAENNDHAFRTGLRVMPSGEAHYNSKLTEAEAEFVRRIYPKLNKRELGRMLGVSESTVRRVLTGESWKPKERS